MDSQENITTKGINQGDNFVDILKNMEKEEGSELVTAMLGIFKDRLPIDIQDIENGLKNNQAEVIKGKAHLMSGSFSSLSFTNGYELARYIELESNRKSPKEIEMMIGDLLSYMKEILRVIKNY